MEMAAMSELVYTTQTLLDALNRPVEFITPDDGHTFYTYMESGLLDSVAVEDVHTLDTDIINAIEYNAKGQRTKVVYENNTATFYEYDAKTYRVKRIRTLRDGTDVLQDLKYWYDAVGNITTQKDDAVQTIYFNNTIVDAHNYYTYDALYRLIKAEGREQNGNTNMAGTPYDA